MTTVEFLESSLRYHLAEQRKYALEWRRWKERFPKAAAERLYTAVGHNLAAVLPRRHV